MTIPPDRLSPPPPPPQDGSAEQAAVIAALALVLASAGSLAPAAILLALLRIMRPYGIDRAPAWTAFKIVRGIRPRVWRTAWAPDAGGPATQAVRVAEPHLRAAYLLNASRRLQSAVNVGGDLGAALRREDAYASAHLRAAQNRAQVASDVDFQSRLWGPVLGWHAFIDNRTSADCRRAHGRNFLADQRPKIGWPGSVHLNCRCRSGSPWPTGLSVDGGTLRPSPRVRARAGVPA